MTLLPHTHIPIDPWDWIILLTSFIHTHTQTNTQLLFFHFLCVSRGQPGSRWRSLCGRGVYVAQSGLTITQKSQERYSWTWFHYTIRQVTLAKFVGQKGQRSACWPEGDTYCNECNVNVLTARRCNGLNVHLCVCVWGWVCLCAGGITKKFIN